jgi:hypothetical protein
VDGGRAGLRLDAAGGYAPEPDYGAADGAVVQDQGGSVLPADPLQSRDRIEVLVAANHRHGVLTR